MLHRQVEELLARHLGPWADKELEPETVDVIDKFKREDVLGRRPADPARTPRSSGPQSTSRGPSVHPPASVLAMLDSRTQPL
jgi:hypothetical protein